jgi:hypothetical protein
MMAMSNLGQLESLHLIGPKIDDAVLAAASSPTVKELFLEDTAITTHAVPRWLSHWPKLEMVHIFHRGTPTSISESDVIKASKDHEGIVFSPERGPDWAKASGKRRLLFMFNDIRPVQ